MWSADMLEVNVTRDTARILHVVVRTTCLDAGCFEVLAEVWARALDQHCAAILLDLSQVMVTKPSGLSALVELAGFSTHIAMALIGAPDALQTRLKELELQRALPCFANRESALASGPFQRIRLQSLRTLIVGSGPASTQTARASFMGIQLLQRLVAMVETAGLPPPIIAVPDGVFRADADWDLGAAIILPPFPTAQHDPDLVDVLKHLRRSGTTGADNLVIPAHCLPAVPLEELIATMSDQAALMPGAVSPFRMTETDLDLLLWKPPAAPLGLPQAAAWDMTTSAGRLAAATSVLSGETRHLQPRGDLVGDRIWIGRTTTLGKGVKLDGPCFVGDSVVIGDHSLLGGVVGVENRARIGADSVLMACHVGEGGVIGDGERLERACISAQSGRPHRPAEGLDADPGLAWRRTQ
jgi:hypothetical protein